MWWCPLKLVKNDKIVFYIIRQFFLKIRLSQNPFYGIWLSHNIHNPDLSWNHSTKHVSDVVIPGSRLFPIVPATGLLDLYVVDSGRSGIIRSALPVCVLEFLSIVIQPMGRVPLTLDVGRLCPRIWWSYPICKHVLCLKSGA